MWVIFLGVVLLLVMMGFVVWYLANEVFYESREETGLLM